MTNAIIPRPRMPVRHWRQSAHTRIVPTKRGLKRITVNPEVRKPVLQKRRIEARPAAPVVKLPMIVLPLRDKATDEQRAKERRAQEWDDGLVFGYPMEPGILFEMAAEGQIRVAQGIEADDLIDEYLDEYEPIMWGYVDGEKSMEQAVREMDNLFTKASGVKSVGEILRMSNELKDYMENVPELASIEEGKRQAVVMGYAAYLSGKLHIDELQKIAHSMHPELWAHIPQNMRI